MAEVTLNITVDNEAIDHLKECVIKAVRTELSDAQMFTQAQQQASIDNFASLSAKMDDLIARLHELERWRNHTEHLTQISEDK